MTEVVTEHDPPMEDYEERIEREAILDEAKPPKQYTIKDIFPTIQGEGFHAGRPALFVRFVGCNLWSGYEADRLRDAQRNVVSCPMWCDTDFTRDGAQKLNAEEILVALQAHNSVAELIVFTGGEPLLQLDPALCLLLRRAGYTLAVETNGTVPLARHFADYTDNHGCAVIDWITCSPKVPPELIQLERCHELKLVLPAYDPAPWQNVQKTVRDFPVWLRDPWGKGYKALYVQPEDGPRFQEGVETCMSWIHQHPDWRISAQTHKILGVS